MQRNVRQIQVDFQFSRPAPDYSSRRNNRSGERSPSTSSSSVGSSRAGSTSDDLVTAEAALGLDLSTMSEEEIRQKNRELIQDIKKMLNGDVEKV